MQVSDTEEMRPFDVRESTDDLLNIVSDEELEAAGSDMVLGGVAANSQMTKSCCWSMKC